MRSVTLEMQRVETDAQIGDRAVVSCISSETQRGPMLENGVGKKAMKLTWSLELGADSGKCRNLRLNSHQDGGWSWSQT